jgi:hypothetical protein
MTLNPDLLRIEFLGVTLRHDEVALPREDLAVFFASVAGRYGLTRMEFHPDAGATFSGPDGAECVLRPAQMASCGVTGMGYREGLERVVGLVGEGILRREEDRLELLAGDEVSLGLRIWRRAGDASVEIAVEPMHAEPSKVYLRLVHTQGEPVADAAALREVSDSVHEFLTGPLTAFLTTRARR